MIAETGTGTGLETGKGTRIEREGGEEEKSGIHHIKKVIKHPRHGEG